MSLQGSVAIFFAIIHSAAGLQSSHKPSIAAVEDTAGCVYLSASDDATFYTAPIMLGYSKKSVDPVVDTGSTQLLIQSSKATNSTKYTGKSFVLSYGSGDVEVAEASDMVQFNGETNNESIYLMGQANSQAFSDIEGILPLSMEDQNVIHTTSFSLCMSSWGGALKLSASGATVAATERWEVNLNNISVNGKSANVSSGQVLPDSGTTLLIGPLNQLEKLFGTACSQWSNCSGSDAVAFVDAIEALGGDCSSNAPDITFGVGGSKTVTITASSYIIKWDGMCYPAFDYFDYDDLWILGLPLFYDNEVAFDVTSTKVGFTAGSCSGCDAGLVQDRTLKQGVREIFGRPREPTLKRSGSKLSEISARNPDLMRLAEALDKRQWNKAS